MAPKRRPWPGSRSGTSQWNEFDQWEFATRDDDFLTRAGFIDEAGEMSLGVVYGIRAHGYDLIKIVGQAAC